jgi:hypothetical protein
MAPSVDSPDRPSDEELLSEIMSSLMRTGQYLEEIAHKDIERIALVRRWGRQAAFLLGLHVRMFTTDPVRLRDGRKVIAVLITKQDAEIVSRLDRSRKHPDAAADIDASDTA